MREGGIPWEQVAENSFTSCHRKLQEVVVLLLQREGIVDPNAFYNARPVK